MKIVLFCGGLGMRLREYSDTVPKPLVPVGDNPLIWHLMKYYAHFGHKDFILCLGHKAELIKKYFIDYQEALSCDFVLSNGGKNVEVLNRDFQDWRITFVDTGIRASVGERLYAVRDYLAEEEVFLANYVDGLTDLNLHTLIDHFYELGKAACFLAVRPTQTFHLVDVDDDGYALGIEHISDSKSWMNGGFFVFNRKIFDFLGPREELVEEPFKRLIQSKELVAYRHRGFWACMDTFKEKQQLEDLWETGNAPWQVWLKNGKM